ncbi:hypothetical protein WOA01_02680 [Methylocystis sp. IM2]|uniref:hypothetical protein n=1 Tax=unclassified Methylocystis TaxID=2625913 RepID=UPI0030FB383D
MNFEPAKDIADAVLFEGYILYPYRASALKNRQRWTFGGLFPRDYAGDEPSSMQTEILVKVADEGQLDVTLRFLHTQRRKIQNAKGDDVDVLDLDGKQYVAWDEAVVREVTASGLALKSLSVHPETMSFSFPAESSVVPLADARGAIQRSCQALQGIIKISATPVEGNVLRVRARAENTTPYAFASREPRRNTMGSYPRTRSWAPAGVRLSRFSIRQKRSPPPQPAAKILGRGLSWQARNRRRISSSHRRLSFTTTPRLRHRAKASFSMRPK